MWDIKALTYIHLTFTAKNLDFCYKEFTQRKKIENMFLEKNTINQRNHCFNNLSETISSNPSLVHFLYLHTHHKVSRLIFLVNQRFPIVISIYKLGVLNFSPFWLRSMITILLSQPLAVPLARISSRGWPCLRPQSAADWTFKNYHSVENKTPCTSCYPSRKN